MSTQTFKTPINLDEFEIIKSGTAFCPSLTITSSAGTYVGGADSVPTTIFHGLGYVPILIIFIKEVSSGKVYPNSFTKYLVPSSSVSAVYNFDAQADINYLYIYTALMVYGASTQTVSGSSYLCQYFFAREKIKRGT